MNNRRHTQANERSTRPPINSCSRVKRGACIFVRGTIGEGWREAQDIAERKKSIIGILGNVAELGASRMEETIGKAGLRDAAIGTGIAVDKMLALTGQLPSVQIANVVLPSPEQDEARRRAHRALDEITRLLHKQEPLTLKEELMIKAQCRILKITEDID